MAFSEKIVCRYPPRPDKRTLCNKTPTQYTLEQGLQVEFAGCFLIGLESPGEVLKVVLVGFYRLPLLYLGEA